MDISDLIDQNTGERKYLNAQERKAFFNATIYKAPDIKFFCQMIYYTGCRPSEARAITPDHLDYAEQGVILRTLKQKKDKPYFRFVELPESYLISLHDIYKVKDKKKSAGKKPLWTFSDRTSRNYIKGVMTEAGITGVKATARGLRHSMGVNLVVNDVPLHIVQKILGHRNINNTRIYAVLMVTKNDQ